MIKYRWSIAIYKGASPFILQPTGRNLPAILPEAVPEMACKTVADPFLVRRDGRWYMFFEALDGATNRGEIAYATSEDGDTWTCHGIVLREDFHLSYPQVFEHRGTFYMIPETRQAGSIRLYAAQKFPFDWKLVSTLVEGDYADATVFFHDGTWRMFSQRGLDEMRLFHSDSLESGWKEHPGNPFWEANRTYCRQDCAVLAAPVKPWQAWLWTLPACLCRHPWELHRSRCLCSMAYVCCAAVQCVLFSHRRKTTS